MKGGFVSGESIAQLDNHEHTLSTAPDFFLGGVFRELLDGILRKSAGTTAGERMTYLIDMADNWQI